ncbi:MAG: hypothetical protein P9M13_04120 [Candidatus Ancaeobacter aquaticus]|nr:hypothetical protein [Candidatus Ancaeobacter aquaticus]
MNKVRPFFKILLFIAVMFYVVATAYMMSDLYFKFGEMDHVMMHLRRAHVQK